MNLRDVLDPGGKLLVRRLDQLCSTLESLSERLRATVANVICDSFGGFVRDAALSVLDKVTQCISEPAPASPTRPTHAYDVHHQDDEGGYWYDDEAPALEPERQPSPAPPQPERCPPAVSAGLQMASFWLRRWSGRDRALTTCAAGIITTFLAFIGGPIAVALFDLAASASQVNALPNAIDKTASTIGLYDPR